jgi:hypothetical protein
MSFIRTGSDDTAADLFFVFASLGASTKVFHARHDGHCPCHFEDSYPHSLQKKALSFAMFPPKMPAEHLCRHKQMLFVLLL